LRCRSISPVCIDPPTLRGGMVEGRRLVAATFDPEGRGIPDEVRRWMTTLSLRARRRQHRRWPLPA